MHTTEAIPMLDAYADSHPPGHVVGGRSPDDGIRRQGVDKEGVIGIDGGALRIGHLIHPGWGRAGIAYGPYPRENGLAFGVLIANGSNAAQAGRVEEGFRQRLRQWAQGTGTELPICRLARWAVSRRTRSTWRLFRHWLTHGTRFSGNTVLDENLAAGWFTGQAPADPAAGGHAFMIHSLGPAGGEVRTGTDPQRVVSGLQNVPMHYVVVLREQGAAYYAASLPGVPAVAAYPTLTPLAIEAEGDAPMLYAGIQQSVSGQIGFRADTRVFRTQVARLAGFDQWCGAAHGADRLTGDGALQASAAERGGMWSLFLGDLRRTPQGLAAAQPLNIAVLTLAAPAGLVHVLLDTRTRAGTGGGLLWRVRDADNLWCFEADLSGCRLSIIEKGVQETVPLAVKAFLRPDRINRMQVLDDGGRMRIHLNGELLSDPEFTDRRLQEAPGTGVLLRGAADADSDVMRSFEAHPRGLPAPPELDPGTAWFAQGERELLRDDFSGPPAALDERDVPGTASRWQRVIGDGIFRLTGAESVNVEASVARPCPGRTAYTVPWPQSAFADLAVMLTPPGTRQGEGEKGRGGFIFQQDARNYITVSLWMNDTYGFSISSFFYLDGYEELYDAVWTNIGQRVRRGNPFELRSVFDGDHYLVQVNGEPVLARALSDVYPGWRPLAIRSVGLVANWEWGTDTGSVFQHFKARARA